jgi:hypothetical protein
VKSKLDLFGLMVLAFAAGNAGGIIRDLLIGAVPPAAISDWRYLGGSLLAGLATFFWYPKIDVRRRPVLLFDGAGLALFAVTGTQKALAAGLNPVMAALMGMLTGIGGGVLRDVLVNETPTVLPGRSVCCRRACRRNRGGGGTHTAVPLLCGHDRRCDSLSLASSHGHIPRLAFTPRKDSNATRLKGRRMRLSGCLPAAE